MISDQYIVITTDGLAYNGENTKNIIGDYVMQDEIKEIATNTFANCSGLTLVRLGSNTVKIGTSSFQNCKKLKTFISCENLETINASAFEGCSSLRLVYLNKGLKTISGKAFASCPELTMIKFRGTMEEWNAISKDAGWHSGNITKIVCHDGTITL